MLRKMCPSFIVVDVGRSVAFYQEKLGFERWFSDPETDSFFATVGRDEAMLFLKSGNAEPTPNATRDADIKWDSYVLVDDPDGLAAELGDRGVAFRVPLGDTSEGLRGFELADPDGYVLFCGRPRT